MSFLRRSTPSLTASIRQITCTKPAKATAVRATAIGALPHLTSSAVNHFSQKKENVGKCVVAHVSNARKVNSFATNNSTSFSPRPGASVVLSSSSSRVQKLFASFDLSSISISFAGMMGDFAVWAICDLSSGELVYLIDDNT